MRTKHCSDCGSELFITDRHGRVVCEDCGWVLDDSNYEPPELDGEAFRGGESAAYLAEQQAWIQRNLK